MSKFNLHSDYKPFGDQPKAIKSLVEHFKNGDKEQTLEGVTGSGKLLLWQMLLNNWINQHS